jgi:hypothetical protein
LWNEVFSSIQPCEDGASVRITGFVDFVHHPEIEITRKSNILEIGSVSVFMKIHLYLYNFKIDIV